MVAHSGSCACCGTPASRRCIGCIEGVDQHGNLSPTAYCSRECQEADWKKHKVECRYANYRKQLYRGALLVQQAFYIFRLIAFDFELAEVRSINGSLRIRVDRSELSSGAAPLYNFPDHLFSNFDDKKAVLCWLASDEAIAYMHELFSKTLKGKFREPPFKGVALTYVGITSTNRLPTEFCFEVDKKHVMIHEEKENDVIEPMFYYHWALRIDLGGAGSFIIDPAGAELGQRRAAMTYMQYMQTYVRQYPDQQGFGSRREVCKKRTESQNDPSLPGNVDYRLPVLHDEIIKSMGRMLNPYESKEKTLVESLNLREDGFELEQARILFIVEGAMRNIRDYALSNPDSWYDEGPKKDPKESGWDLLGIPKDKQEVIRKVVENGGRHISLA